MKRRDPTLLKYSLILLYKIIGKIYDKDKRIARRLPHYFPTYRSFAGESLNQILRYASSPRSFSPQGIVIEPTNHCNLKCKHCTAQTNDEERGYMDYEFYKRILDTNPQITCLMLSRYGEPFLHPRIFEMIEYAKGKNIYVFTYTNGVLLSEDKIDRIFASRLDEINFSVEGTGEEYEKNRGISYDILKRNLECLIDKRRTTGSKIRIGINMTEIDGKDDNAEAVKREWQGRVDYIDIGPLVGRRMSIRTASCRILWRNTVIRWDGTAFPCCIDMNSSLALGDLKTASLKEIFNGDKAVSLRESHLKRKFPEVCKYCGPIFG